MPNLYFNILPYVEKRAKGEELQISDYKLDKDVHCYVDNPSPTDADIQALDTSPFRWVYCRNETLNPPPPEPTVPGSLTSPYISILENTYLGTVIVPIKCLNSSRNFTPSIFNGTVKKNNSIIESINLLAPSMTIFNGFSDSDYANDTKVEFSYVVKDQYGLTLKGTTLFFGKSIILIRNAIQIYTIDPDKIAFYDQVAHDLVEKGLVQQTLPEPAGPGLLLDKLRKDDVFQKEIKTTINGVKSDPITWESISEKHVELFNQNVDMIMDDSIDILNKALDNIIVTTIAEQTISKISSNPVIKQRIKNARKGLKLVPSRRTWFNSIRLN